jgi:hypothetical protein
VFAAIVAERVYMPILHFTVALNPAIVGDDDQVHVLAL